MTDNSQADTSKPSTANSNQALSATAAFLIVSGLVLLIAAVMSKQWLEAQSRYDEDAYGAGLFTSAASSGAQFVAVVCLGATGLLAVLGFVWRFLLTLSLGFAMVGATAVSWWILNEPTWQMGRAYPFAMFALLVLIMGLSAGVSSGRTVGPKSKGSFVDGQKHGRWYVYDDNGDCVSMEEWEHGALVGTKPVKRS